MDKRSIHLHKAEGLQMKAAQLFLGMTSFRLISLFPNESASPLPSKEELANESN